MVGKSRGGPAKVAVIASGLFGSINGAPMVNVATTGAITIPAMKKLGYSSRYAGAVEACASTAGVLMPPIMGATAVIMCPVLGLSYSEVIVAAFIPAVLYYLSLLLQVDAYAVKAKLKGLSADSVPSLWQTLRQGWPYLVSLGFLIFQLLYMRVVILSPYYATALLLITVMIRKKTRLVVSEWLEMIVNTGKTIAMILSLLIGVGFILGSLMMTGVAFAFSHEMITLAHGNALLLLLLGALVSFVLGMGMTISACYVFLAMTMAPPLVKMGFDPLAVHLFVMYYGMLSSITPPVALAAFAAAGISGSSPMKTGFTAMRIGIILFIVPFVFVLKPALIFHGPLSQTVYLFVGFLLGIVFIVGGTEGYIIGLGRLGGFFSPFRLVSYAAGVMLIIPNRSTDLAGLGLAAVVSVICFIRNQSIRRAYTGHETSQ
jgi:TRAP transporter 4TM/12TM fusion protein